MPHVYAFANQKGGVGKSTTSASAAVGLAEQGKKVLLVDMDPQANATAALGVPVDENGPDGSPTHKTVFHLLTDRVTSLSDVICHSYFEGVDVVPSSIELAGAELALQQKISSETSLLKKLSRATGYDYIIIDCPPALGQLTINALVAADSVIIPTEPARWSVNGMQQLMRTIEDVRDSLNPELRVRGILPTKYDTRTGHAKDMLAVIQEKFPDLVFATRIDLATAVNEANTAGQSVLTYDPRSKAAMQYRTFVAELLEDERPQKPAKETLVGGAVV